MRKTDKDNKKGEVSLEKQDRKPLSLKEPRFIVSALLLVITLGMSQGIEFREAIPMNRSFNKFPMKVGKWEGTRQIMEQKFIDTLDLSDYIIADYQDASSGKAINFYVAYYESQRKGESIHSPASCLRGGGWQFRQAGKLSLVLNNGKHMPLNRAIIEKEPVKQVSYYWFPSRGRILTNAYQMKIFNFWDALTRQRTDGALVRVITLVYPDESTDQAEARMKDFINDISPVLSDFLPE
jgi:EpsI family protein